MTKTDQELVEQSQQLSTEVQTLLIQDGLLATIQTFGVVFVGGSAALGLLVRPDVDVNVRLADNLDTAKFFAIGAAVTQQYQVLTASYANHLLRHLPPFDHGLYWSIQLKHGDHVWNLDLWGYGQQRFDAQRRHHVELANLLSAVDRLAILRLKDALREGDGYWHGVTALDIYKAMYAGGARTVAQFEEWWGQHPAA